MTMRVTRFCLYVAIGFICLRTGNVLLADSPQVKAQLKLTFEEHVLPIFKAKCVKCHAGAEPAMGLRLTSRRDLLRGGESGPAMRIAAAESSLIWEKLTSNEMPKSSPPLSAEEKGIIRSWINDGANSTDPSTDDDIEVHSGAETQVSDHWAFRPPVRPSVPRVSQGPLSNPIDSLIVAALEIKGLSLSSPAGKAVLLRRATFDLIGLPPTLTEYEEFLADSSDDAYERLIDRLLASPHYGERWSRHWLDVAGYADSAGVLAEDRPLQTAFRYRDYVIRAMNRDLPYDQFLREQIAGDELSNYWTAYDTLERLPDDVVEAVTATGYLRCAPDSSRPDFSTIKNADAQYYYPTINDTLQIVASSTMALTLQCARCHSHKYDPIPQSEYYQLQAIFMSAYRPKQWIPQMERRILIASAAQKRVADEHNGKLEIEIARLKKELAEHRAKSQQQLFEDRLAALPETIRGDVKEALEKAADQRSEVQKYLVDKFQNQLRPDEKTLDKLLPDTFSDFKQVLEQTNKSIAEHERRRMYFDELRALYDLPGPAVTPLLRRGDPLTPGANVEPGVLSALAAPVSFQWTAPAEEAKTSGRRTAFARWLTQPYHPLTARVMVNRIWLQHFGEGLVSTPEDFGMLGAAPSHPQMLDWLAREFVESGWEIKRLTRTIMVSQTYRQRSTLDEQHHAKAISLDPDNRLLWRQRMRRIEAEPLRDAMLTVAGLIDHRMFGYPIPVARRPDGEVTIADGQNNFRRSVYVQVLRGNPLTMLQTYDQPVMETNCTRRGKSTVSTQALTLLNSDSCNQYAMELAQRAVREAGTATVEWLIRVAWGREASQDELQLCEQFWAAQQTRYLASGDQGESAKTKALADLCHMILASNEFVYVD